MGTLIFKPVTSGTPQVLPAPVGPNTKVTVVVQNIPLNTKVALAGVLAGQTYGIFDAFVKAGSTIIGQLLGTGNKANLAQAQRTITEHDHPLTTTSWYRTAFAQQNPLTWQQIGDPKNPLYTFVVPFSDLAAYYRIDAELARLKNGGALRIVSAIAS